MPQPQRHNGSQVPAEWIGRARALRTKVAATTATATAIAEGLVAPLRPRPGFLPMPKHALLREFPAVWKRGMPAFGRLRLVAGFEGGKLQVVELRTEPMAITAAGWSEDEPAIAVILKTLVIRPPEFEEKAIILAVAGLHALARRYQRSRERADDAVLRDLLPLARGAVNLARAGGGEFAIPIPAGGRWIGSATEGVVNVRTFIEP